jgi:uncharacterized protein (TIGR03435 family)
MTGERQYEQSPLHSLPVEICGAILFAIAGIAVAPGSLLPGTANASAQAKPQPQNLPEFEVASLKPSNPKRSGGVGWLTYPGGRVVIGHSTLEMLIEFAFDVHAFQISGGPGWINDDQYDIEARAPATSKSSKANPSSPKAPLSDEQRQMLQALLIDRFHLKFHRSTREGTVYVLVVGNKELKLTERKDKGDFSWVGSPRGGAINGDGMAGENISMPVLATRLSRYLGHPVLDKTRLKGFFDFKFEYASDDANADVIASIFTSVQGIGLKLKTAKGPVETIFIDHVDKPSEN